MHNFHTPAPFIGAAFASGFVGAIGYGGASILTFAVRDLANSKDGWVQIWYIATGLTFISTLVSILYYYLDWKDVMGKKQKVLPNESIA